MLFGRTSFHWPRQEASFGCMVWRGQAARLTSPGYTVYTLAGPTTYMSTAGSQPANTAGCRHNVKANTVVALGTWMVWKVTDQASCFTE